MDMYRNDSENLTIGIEHLRTAADMVRTAGGDRAGAIGQLLIDLAIAVSTLEADGKNKVEAKKNLKVLAQSRVYGAWTL
jgi:hypothetical protein